MSYLFICLVPLLFYSNTISKIMETYFSEERALELKRYGNRVAVLSQVKQVLTDDSIYEIVLKDLEDRCRNNNIIQRIMILNNQAIVVVDSGKMYEGTVFAAPEERIALGGQSATNLQPDKNSMYASVYILSDDSHDTNTIGTVLLISNINEINYMLDQIQQNLLLIVILLAIIVFVLVFFISQLIIDPIKDILNVVKKMSEGHLYQKIKVVGHDEFAEVSTAFNDMSNKLELVETSRQEFVSNVSHELKTPLSSIKVLSDSLLLQNDVPNYMYREFLQDITSEVDRMTAIINELLAIVRLDQMEQPLNIESVDITKMLEDVMKRLAPLAEQKNIQLLYEETQRFTTLADEMKLTLVFSNLIENAIKYTLENGQVTVLVDGDHQNMFITVQDNGIGIAEEDQSKVFDRFYRVDKTRDRETGGTGLGLAIAHKIVLLHDGSIKLFSKENEGSSFVVRLLIGNEE